MNSLNHKSVLNYLVFCIVWFFIQIFRIIPFVLVQAISRFFYVIAFHLIRYRREVVYANLRNSFPEKTDAEITDLSKRFYQYFTDILAETVKGYTMSIPSLTKRFGAVNPGLTNAFFEKGKSIMLIGGHYGNQEWGKTLGKQMKHQLVIVYSPFTNPFIESYQQKTRGIYDMNVLPVKRTLRFMIENRRKTLGYIFGVDQRPFDLQNCIWVRFLNQDTPCHTGYEQLARKFNMPVVYIDIQVVKRGYYTFHTELITENPADLPEGAIVKAFMKLLQDTIKNRPEFWLWSHKRWKFKKPEGVKVCSLDNQDF